MVQRCLDPERQIAPPSAGESPSAPRPAGCAVVVVGASTPALLEQLSAELSAARPWLVEGGAVIIWQLESSPDEQRGEPWPAAAPFGLRELGDGEPLERGGRYFVAPQRRVWFEGTRVCVALRAPSDQQPVDRLLLSLAEGWGSRCASILALPDVDDGECGLRIVGAVGGFSARRAATRARATLESGLAPATAAARAACAEAARRGAQRGRLRVWLPACKTGGLTYTLAMLLSEAGDDAPLPFELLVFGTDQDEAALAIARTGRYPARLALGMDPDLRGRYTFDEGDTIRMSEALREVCIFSRHSLARDLPMARMDLVVCHRVFDGVAASERDELIDALYHSLHDGGLLLALDHVELFPEDLFEHLDEGYLRARPGGRSRRRHARAASANEEVTSVKAVTPLASPSVAASVLPFVRSVGIPLLLCDARLRVVFISDEARAAFGLLRDEPEPELATLSPELPGGLELVPAAWRALKEKQPEELVIRDGSPVYLARLSVTSDGAEPGLSITFTDVTQLETARSRAVELRYQHAALARLTELSLAEPQRMYDDALALLFSNISVCSAGVIVELEGHRRALRSLASRGLGTDPLRTLRQPGGGAALLEAVVERGCIVTQSGDLATWVHPETPAPAAGARALPHRSALSSIGRGLGCPITADGVLLGVIGLYGRRAGIDDGAHQDLLQAVANLLGVAIVRQRTRRRLSLELEVSRLLAGASDLSPIAEGLLAALGPALSVDEVELWSAPEPSHPAWLRIAPVVEGKSPAPPWPAQFVDQPGGLFSSASREHGELLVTIPRRDAAPALLRLQGRGLHEPDAELSEGLQRIARMLAEFLERLSILERSRQSEASFRQKSAELEALYASLPVGVTIHDSRGAIRHVNRHLAPLQAASDAPGAQLLQQLYAREMPAWVERVLDSGEPIHDVELFVTQGSRTHSWLCNFAPIRDAEGRVHGASVVVQDITALKRVEATLREADQQKDDFLAMLGHELRNPMAAIRNATELLSRIEDLPPQLRRLQSIFDRQTLQTTKLIDGLLDVARVARGKVELVLKPVQLIELVRQVVDDRRQQFQERRLDLALPEGELWALADRVRLVQILDNLISNALKFTRPGGRIGIQLLRLNRRGAIRVEDDGAGIEAELLPQIFEPFRQGRTPSAQSQGLGLGLALVKGLVDLHGFQLRAHSDGPGRGARFQIDFPLTAAPESAAPESRLDTRKLDLLLVEDNLDIADTLAELLTATGHTVELAGSAEQALERLRERRPEVVLCDIGLPGMDGLELATRLRADPELTDLKLVAMTGFGDASTQGRIEKAGFDRHLIKPVQLEALRQCLSRVAALPASRLDRL
jgi:signal transduction histidine kinase/ActR/RegA family two-component response regulator